MAIQSRLSTNRYAIRDQVTRFRLAAFFILAYTTSALGWLLSDRIDLGVVNGLGVVFSAGPALAAMIAAGCCGHSRRGFRRLNVGDSSGWPACWR